MRQISSIRTVATILTLLLVGVPAAAQAGEHDSCHLGAYRDQAGHVLALTAAEGNALRFYLLDGRSGLLTPAGKGIYTAGPDQQQAIRTQPRGREPFEHFARGPREPRGFQGAANGAAHFPVGGPQLF